jgi:hypothetical protein
VSSITRFFAAEIVLLGLKGNFVFTQKRVEGIPDPLSLSAS